MPNVQRTTRKKVPFGVAQIGKSFRNEITPGNFTFRTREFEQMELEFFCKPDTDLEWFYYWRGLLQKLAAVLGHARKKTCACGTMRRKNYPSIPKLLRILSILFPFGWGELWGIADRTNYDLKQHQDHSGKSLEYFDPADQ